jgi:hypothetical protein
MEQETEIQEGAQDEVQVSPVEQKAMQMGWRPEQEWDGDPEDWVDAKEYIGRQKLYDRIQDSNKRLKQMEKTLDEFKKHHDKVAEVEYEKALATLKAEKVRVLQEGDAAELVEIDDKIDAVKEKIKESKQAPKTPEADPEFQRIFGEWQDRNSWYRDDPNLKKDADIYGYAIVSAHNGQITPEEVLREIEKEIKRKYPDKFMNTRKAEPNRVETGGGKGKGTNKDSGADVVLSDEESQAMRRFVRQGILTEAQYKAEVKKLRERA